MKRAALSITGIVVLLFALTANPASAQIPGLPPGLPGLPPLPGFSDPFAPGIPTDPNAADPQAGSAEAYQAQGGGAALNLEAADMRIITIGGAQAGLSSGPEANAEAIGLRIGTDIAALNAQTNEVGTTDESADDEGSCASDPLVEALAPFLSSFPGSAGEFGCARSVRASISEDGLPSSEADAGTGFLTVGNLGQGMVPTDMIGGLLGMLPVPGLDSVVDGLIAGLVEGSVIDGEFGRATGDTVATAETVTANGAYEAIVIGLLDPPDVGGVETDPLLEIELGPSTATAVYDRATGTATTEGVAGQVTIRLGGDLQDLLGELGGGDGTSPIPGLEDNPLCMLGLPLPICPQMGGEGGAGDLIPGPLEGNRQAPAEETPTPETNSAPSEEDNSPLSGVTDGLGAFAPASVQQVPELPGLPDFENGEVVVPPGQGFAFPGGFGSITVGGVTEEGEGTGTASVRAGGVQLDLADMLVLELAGAQADVSGVQASGPGTGETPTNPGGPGSGGIPSGNLARTGSDSWWMPVGIGLLLGAAAIAGVTFVARRPRRGDVT